MSKQIPGRRTALKTIGGCLLGTVTAVSSVGASERSRSNAGGCRLPPRVEPPSADALTNRPDVYIAVVDRIVDGAHVVLLRENDGDLVDQHVLPVDSAVLPDVTESDVLLVRLANDTDGGSEAEAEETVVEARQLPKEAERRRREREERLEELFD